MRIEPEQWRKTKRGYSGDQLAKHGWGWPKKKCKTCTKRLGTNYDRSTWSFINYYIFYFHFE